MGIQLGTIVKSRFNVTIYNDQDDIAALSQSIEKEGLINKVVLRNEGSNVACIAGMRRVEAIKLLRGPEGEIEENEYDFVDCDDEKAFLLSVAENIKRFENCTAEMAEVAHNLSVYAGSEYTNPSSVAKVLNMSEARASMLLQLYKDKKIIPESIRSELKKSKTKNPLCDEHHWHVLREVIGEKEVFESGIDLILNHGTFVVPRDLKNHVDEQVRLREKASGKKEKTQSKTEKKKNNSVAEWKYKGEAKIETEEESGEQVLMIGPDKIDFAAMKETLIKFNCFVALKISAYARPESVAADGNDAEKNEPDKEETAGKEESTGEETKAPAKKKASADKKDKKAGGKKEETSEEK